MSRRTVGSESIKSVERETDVAKEGQGNVGKVQRAPNPQERDVLRSLALLQIPSVRADKPKQGAQIQEIVEEQQKASATR